MKVENESKRRASSLILHPSIWPDSGLTRNTRCRCYRCSVPGLAGFARRALCGARSLITFQNISNFRLPEMSLNLCLAMGYQSQESVDSNMQDDIGDYRHHNWQQQCMSLLRAGAVNDAFERCVEGIGNGDDKLNKARGAVCCH